MQSVEFDLQDSLSQMEERLLSRLAALHGDVKVQNGRIRILEQEVFKVRWLWRAASGVVISFISWASYQAYTLLQ